MQEEINQLRKMVEELSDIIHTHRHLGFDSTKKISTLGKLTADIEFIDGSSTSRTIYGGDGIGNGNGDTLWFSSGDAGGSGEGGSLGVSGGNATSGSAGDVTMVGGQNTNAYGGQIIAWGGDTTGGKIDIVTGAGKAGNTDGGNLNITLSAGYGSGVNGKMNITGLPTSSAGLSTGDIYVSSGALKIV